MKIRNLIRKCKYSEDSVYIFTELGNKQKSKEAMYFHENKFIILSVLCTLLIELVVLGIIFVV